jgi:short-subunit dehydrogenase
MRRAVMVTGADSGIGLATVRHLDEAGFDVIGVVVDERAAGTLAAEAGPRVVPVVADLSDPAARAGLVAQREPWGLVNNAGYMNAGQIADVPLDDARRQLEVMVVAPVDLIRQALPAMISRGQGRIVNVTSSAAHTSTPLTAWYAACKAALRELNDAVREEVGGTGVDVIDVEPGGYRTGIWARAEEELKQRRLGARRRDIYDRVLQHLDQGEAIMADPEDVGKAITQLLTTGEPGAHRRIGPGARWLRAADDLVPDRVWDKLVSAVGRPQP